MPKKRKDNILKDYMSKNEIFADIVNYYLYDGKDVVKETDLKELDTTFVNDNDEIFEKTRDLLKEVTIKEDNKITYILVGIENQLKIDFEMIYRVLLYDGLTHRKQVKMNDDIKPVITIVIYYGRKKWNAPRSLHEYHKIDGRLQNYIPNYHLNLIEPYQMKDEDIEKFKSDFKAICDFIRCSNSVEGIDKLREKNYNGIGKDTVGVINYITDSKLMFDEKEDRLDMCKGLDEFAARAKAEGEVKGKAEGKAEGAKAEKEANIKTMHKNGASADTISKLLSLDINYVKEVLAK